MRCANKNIKFGISDRTNGQMKFYEGENNNEAQKNRVEFFKLIGLDPDSAVGAFQTHSNNIKIVESGNKGSIFNNTDVLLTSRKGIILTVTVADCLPIYFYDEDKKVIGLAHAGRVGVHNKIVSDVIKKMIEHFESKVSDIHVYIGPHIQVCHYEENLSSQVKEELLSLGVQDKNIEITKECTYCEEKYYSYRREEMAKTKTVAQVAYIVKSK